MKIDWTRHDLTTARPFGIARWTHQSYGRVWVSVEHDGTTGWGEATPNAYYGETPETVLAVLPTLAEAVPDDPWAWWAAAEAMEARFPHHHRSAQGALESALLDLAGRRADLPAHRLLGLPGTGGTSSVTVGLGPRDAIRQQAAEHVREGRHVLKVKLGGDDDEGILEAIREGAPEARLRVDANAAWTVRRARAALPMLEAFDVELVEQPVAADDLAGLAEVTRASRIPVVADESFVSLRDLRTLHVDVVNVKLAKVGGPRRAMTALEATRGLGFGTMLGCMIESSLATAAAVHVAALADAVDLDGPLLLRDDPWRGLSWEAGGVVRPGPDAGLGVRPSADRAV